MPQVILNIPENKYAFFMELMKSLAFVKQVKEGSPTHLENEENDYRPRTKKELLEDFKEALEEVKLIREGKKKGKSFEEFLNELQD